MNRRWQIRAALTVSTMILAATFGRPLTAQTADPDSIAAQIVETVHDSNLVSPISGAPIALAALRLVGEAITAPTADTRARMTQALSPSAVSARDIDALLTSLSELGVSPTQAHVQEVAMDFNSFVNLASRRFLSDPPAEFLALHALLLHVASRPLVSAATPR